MLRLIRHFLSTLLTILAATTLLECHGLEVKDVTRLLNELASEFVQDESQPGSEVLPAPPLLQPPLEPLGFRPAAPPRPAAPAPALGESRGPHALRAPTWREGMDEELTAHQRERARYCARIDALVRGLERQVADQLRREARALMAARERDIRERHAESACLSGEVQR